MFTCSATEWLTDRQSELWSSLLLSTFTLETILELCGRVLEKSLTNHATYALHMNQPTNNSFSRLFSILHLLMYKINLTSFNKI